MADCCGPEKNRKWWLKPLILLGVAGMLILGGYLLR